MKVFAEYKYLMIIHAQRRPGAKTPLYYVCNYRRSNTVIGEISWYGTWRQFCLVPNGSTVWSDGCLEDIRDALKRIADDYKKEQAERKKEANHDG